MYTHEIYISKAQDVRRLTLANPKASIQAYNIAPDTEMFVAYIVTRYSHDKILNWLVLNNIDFEEVITNKV